MWVQRRAGHCRAQAYCQKDQMGGIATCADGLCPPCGVIALSFTCKFLELLRVPLLPGQSTSRGWPKHCHMHHAACCTSELHPEIISLWYLHCIALCLCLFSGDYQQPLCWRCRPGIHSCEAAVSLLLFPAQSGSPTLLPPSAGVVYAAVGQQQQSQEYLKIAQQCFQLVGSSATECDTIPGMFCSKAAAACRCSQCFKPKDQCPMAWPWTSALWTSSNHHGCCMCPDGSLQG